MKPVRLARAAQEELSAAEDWYEENAGLGVDLVHAVRVAAQQISDRPSSFPLAPGVRPSTGIRRCPVERFPYALYFVELADEFRVLAVAHVRRRPGYWRGRQ